MEGHRVGSVIAGRFRLEREVGRGGFANVWRALDAQTQRPVALKLLRGPMRGSRRARFEREAKILDRLRHPNVAEIVGWGIDGDPYIALEYIEGRTLHAVMQFLSTEERTIDHRVALQIADQLTAGVEFAHQHGIIHRDLKPHNVMLTSGGGIAVKILDFGVAKVLQDSLSQATTQGRRLGTAGYLAPEQIRASGVDARADVFALGTLLFEVMTLRRAWVVDGRGEPVRYHLPLPPGNEVKIVEQILRGERPPATRLRPDLPLALDALLARAMAVEREGRIASAGALREAFREALTEQQSEESSPTLLSDLLVGAPEPELTTVAPVEQTSSDQPISYTPAIISVPPPPSTSRQELAAARAPGKKSRAALITALIGAAASALVALWVGTGRPPPRPAGPAAAPPMLRAEPAPVALPPSPRSPPSAAELRRALERIPEQERAPILRCLEQAERSGSRDEIRDCRRQLDQAAERAERR